MKKITLLLPLAFVSLLFSCQNNAQNNASVSNLKGKEKNDTLYLFCDGECELGVPSGFKDAAGKIVIEKGKYDMIWTDRFVDFALVSDKKNTGGKVVAIDRKEKVLFEVYWFDNGPDYVSEGLFRIKKDGKIGYANEKGEIVIACQYACAEPFSEGQARVSKNCELVYDGEHQMMKSDEWIFIDKTGKVVEK